MPFDGIPIPALDFYEDLEADNSKAFWMAHKHIYDESVKAPLEALAGELTEEFGQPKYFRPYRDVRFAKDKTPYKTHQGIYFAESRRYFHVSAAGLFVGGGYYEMASDQITRYRRAVAEEVAVASLLQAITAARKAKLELGGEQLTRVPSGFERDHPQQDLLRRKAITVHREFGSPDWLPTKRAKTELLKAWRAMGPLIEWLDANVGKSDHIVAKGR
ncbi:MAG: hypothetical protein QOE71_399 [Pseudonocardiales bacterium]|jgi:uncharacterized protein (TIGR02453 family)|nr:hypothetical protein [Pseudonocardiales bacterium]